MICTLYEQIRINYLIVQTNLNSSNTCGSVELVMESLRNSAENSRKQILRENVLFCHEIVCCVYSLESPHRGDSNEYTQHTIIV